MNESRPDPRIVLLGVTVVDTHDGSLTADTDVVIEGDLITELRVSGSRIDDAQLIDATGQFIVPGFLDMHTHVIGADDPSGDLDLLLANGITGFRLMGGSFELLERRHSGYLPIGPRAPALLSMPGDVLTPMNAGSIEAAVATVRQQHAAGADFIKAGFVTPSVFFAAQTEAHNLGIPIVGHLPTGIDVAAASAGGMRCIEHLGPGVGVLGACSDSQVSILRDLAAAPSRSMIPPLEGEVTIEAISDAIRKMLMNPLLHYGDVEIEMISRAVRTFSEEKALGLAAQFVADGTWQCATLIRVRTCELSDEPEYRGDPNHRYVPASIREDWHEASDRFDLLSSELKDTFREFYEFQLRITKLFDKAGVKMIAGSDGGVWEVPGFSLHQEFDELARAGLSPLRVLQMTTLDAAEFLGRSKTLGAVDKGKVADLVLLNGNPMETVKNLHDISGVVRQGHYFSRADLDQLKDNVAVMRSASAASGTACC